MTPFFVKSSYYVYPKSTFLNFSVSLLIDEFYFVVWLTDERRSVLLPAGTIVIDPHHHEFLTRHEQDLNLRRANF